MKKTIMSILLGAFGLQGALHASIDINQQILDDAGAQLTGAENEIVARLNLIKSDLLANHDHVAYGLSEYCSITDQDPACSNKETATQITEQGIIIDKIAWGFVLNGDESNTDYEDIINKSPTNIYNAPFTYASPTMPVLKNHLCVEVQFKDASEIDFALPFYAGKTVILCAVSSTDDSSLVDIDYVDSDPMDGYGDENHAIIPSGAAGWRCYNPHNDLGNGGAGFGFDYNPITDTVSQVGRVNSGVLYNCQISNYNSLSN